MAFRAATRAGAVARGLLEPVVRLRLGAASPREAAMPATRHDKPIEVPNRRSMNPGDEAPAGTPGTGENVCPACHGTGKLRGAQACVSCGGTGRIVAGIGGA
jgi:hypothetical protein